MNWGTPWLYNGWDPPANTGDNSFDPWSEEDSTCSRATKPASHDYWNPRTLETMRSSKDPVPPQPKWIHCFSFVDLPAHYSHSWAWTEQWQCWVSWCSGSGQTDDVRTPPSCFSSPTTNTCPFFADYLVPQVLHFCAFYCLQWPLKHNAV